MKPTIKYYVLLLGDNVHDVVMKNFEDEMCHAQITLVSDDKKVNHQAWELSLDQLTKLRVFLETQGYREEPKVAIQINDGEIRLAKREEYDAGRRHQKKQEEGTRIRLGKTAAVRAPRVQRKQSFFVAVEPHVKKVVAPEHPQFPL